MNRIEQFLTFLWDFVIGDDWRIALGVAVGLVVTLVLSDNGISSWWLLPVMVVLMLSLSVWSVARSARNRS
jgi:hypothetical protein